ncbi:MAG: hypothetical protein KA354_22010 [Phycisphaerae bacterium]|nr:hypothetical protein [Phycisphaerae bacterium]
MRKQRSSKALACGLALCALGAIASGAANAQTITGQWDFDDGTLKATVGTDATYWIKPADTRDVESETKFGTTTSFGIPDIGGQATNVMKFPQCTRNMGYAMYPGAEANGGGTYVNEFTIIMDILFPTESDATWRGLLQTNNCNTNDGDFFVNPENGIGIGGNYQGPINPNTWYRVALSVNCANTTDGYRKFIDGALVGSQSGQGFDGRMSLNAASANPAEDLATLLFTDEDNEDATGYVSSIQIRNYQMTDDEVAALGAPTATKIPGGTGVTGQWDFLNGSLAATTGRDLAYFKGCTPGGTCSQNLPAEVKFGTTTSFGIANINGWPAKVMQFPKTLQCDGFQFAHGAAPNGGGSLVNQWSMIMDVMFPDTATGTGGYVSLIQTDLFNDNDGETFIKSGAGLGISGNYIGDVTDGVWHRFTLVSDMAVNTYTTYIDGTQAIQNIGNDDEVLDGRFALYSTILMFVDQDGETALGYVNSIQFRDYAMTPTEIATLGGPTAAGIGRYDRRPAPDVNNDSRVDSADFDAFRLCYTGPTITLAEANLTDCGEMDFDEDNDVDHSDFGIFQRCYSGPAAYDPACTTIP